MKKLSVEEEVKRGLIIAKYKYPATCTTYKNGIPTSSRVVTHNEKEIKEAGIYSYYLDDLKEQMTNKGI